MNTKCEADGGTTEIFGLSRSIGYFQRKFAQICSKIPNNRIPNVFITKRAHLLSRHPTALADQAERRHCHWGSTVVAPTAFEAGTNFREFGTAAGSHAPAAHLIIDQYCRYTVYGFSSVLCQLNC